METSGPDRPSLDKPLLHADGASLLAGVEGATPYALRHSFASLLLHEGRSVIYVARQLGHDARLTLGTYARDRRAGRRAADARGGRDPGRP